MKRIDELPVARLIRSVASMRSAAFAAALAANACDPAALAADQPGSPPQAERADNRSDAMLVEDLGVPVLDDPALIANGAAEYAQMCALCHLGPGVPDNDLRGTLNPPAPELAKQPPLDDVDLMAARLFRIVKHGVENSAMPAWGETHDDASLWSIVAFLLQLPTLTPEQYAQATANSKAVHDALHRVDQSKSQ